MAFIRCNLSGGGVKAGTLTVSVSGSANKNSIDFSSPGTPNNWWTNTGNVVISLDGVEIGKVPFTISLQANMHPSQSGVSYIHTSVSGSGTVKLK